MKMKRMEVGKIITEFIGHPEAPKFGLSDDGAELMVFFNAPTEKEVRQFASKKPFEIRFVKLKNIFMICVKIGELEWMDMPYSPHLSKQFPKLMSPNDNQGMALIITCLDNRTGVIKENRLLGLSNKFTRDFFAEILDETQNPFSREEFEGNLKTIYSRYSTRQLVKLSTSYSKNH